MLRSILLAWAFLMLAGTASASGPTLGSATARTLAGQSAEFTLRVAARVAGVSVTTSERGAVSFGRRQAHVYKLVPGNPIPEEIILVGAWEYTNANVQAALNDPSVHAWTKLDTRRLPKRVRASRIDDLAHVRTLAYLAGGVARPVRVPASGPASHFRGVVDPALVLRGVPSADRAVVRAAIASDYSSAPFPAEFWLDGAGRVVRVSVAYRTAHGGRIAVTGTFSHFGAHLDLRLPPANDMQDITP